MMPSWMHGDKEFNLRDILPFFTYDNNLLNVYRDFVVCGDCGSRWDCDAEKRDEPQETCPKCSPKCKKEAAIYVCNYCEEEVRKTGDKEEKFGAAGSIYSLARGMLLGDLSNLDLPKLTFLEAIALSPARHLGLLVKVGGLHSLKRMRSHVTHFPQENALSGLEQQIRGDKSTSWMAKRLEELPQEITVSFVDAESKSSWDSKFFGTVCQLKADTLIAWAKARIALEWWFEQLPHGTTLVSPAVRQVASKLFPYLTGTLENRLSAFAEEHDDIQKQAGDLQNVLSNEGTVMSDFARAMEKQLPAHSVAPLSGDRGPEDDPNDPKAEQERELPHVTHSAIPLLPSAADEKRRTIGSLHLIQRRGAEPISEFGDGLETILDSYWPLWPLGARPLLTEAKNLRAATPKYLLEHASERLRNQRLTFFLTNLRQRHAILRSCAARVNSNPEGHQTLAEFMNNKDAKRIIQNAMEDPEGPDAKYILNLAHKSFKTSGHQADFTPQKRDKSFSLIQALIRFLGKSSVFVTLNFDEARIFSSARACARSEAFDRASTAAGRRACSDPHSPFMSPTLLGKKLSELIKVGLGEGAPHIDVEGDGSLRIDLSHSALRERSARYAVSSVKAVLRRLELVLQHFLACRHTSYTRKTKPEGNKSVFGRSRGFFGVLECQQKGTLHMHLLFHGGPHWDVMRYALTSKRVFEALKSYMEDVFHESVPLKHHLLYIAMKATGRQLHPILDTPQNTDDDSIEQCTNKDWVYANAVFLMYHVRHSPTCTKSKRGQHGCRMRMPRPHDIDRTRLLLLARKDDGTVQQSAFKQCPRCLNKQCEVKVFVMDSETSKEQWGTAKAASGTWELARPELENVAQGNLRQDGETVEAAAERLIRMSDDELRQTWSNTVKDVFAPHLRNFEDAFWTRLGFSDSEELVELMQGVRPGTEGWSRSRVLQACFHVLSVPCMNGHIMPFNPLVLAAMRSNMVCEGILHRVGDDAEEQSMAVAFYISQYKTKDSQVVSSPVAVLYDLYKSAARMALFPSQAEDDGSVDRIAKRSLQSMANRQLARSEMFESEMIANLLQVPSEWHSHSYAYVNVRGAMSQIKQGWPKSPGEMTTPATEDACTDEIYELSEGQARKKVPVPAATFYRYRGPRLRYMNLLEYTALVEIKREDRSAEERDNEHIPFDMDHPLFDGYVQVLKRKFSCVVLAGRNPPTLSPEFFEKLPPPTEKVDDNLPALVKKYKTSSEVGKYFRTLFIPWDHTGGPPELESKDENELQALIKWFRTEAEAETSSDNYRSTMVGRWRMFKRFCAPIRGGDKNADLDKVKCRHVDPWHEGIPGRPGAKRCPLAEPIGKLSRLDKSSRGGDRDDRDETHEDGTRLDEEAQRTMRHFIEKCSNRGEEAKTKRKMEENEAHVEHMKEQFIMDHDGEEKFPRHERKAAVKTSTASAEEVKEEYAKINTPGTEPNEISATSTVDERRKEWATTLIERNKEDNGHELQAPRNGWPALLSKEQQPIAHEIISYLIQLKTHKDDHNAKKPPPMYTLLHGGPGCGKTYLLKTIQWVLETLELPAILQTAFTGIAACNMPRGMTSSKLLRENPMRGKATKTTDKYKMAVEPQEYGMLWIDEISMLKAEQFVKLDEALRHNYPMQGDKQSKEAAFGGMAVVLSGDFQQLPVVAGLSIIDGLLERCNRNPKPPKHQKFQLQNKAFKRRSADLLQLFRKRELTSQQRCLDEKHNQNLRDLRNLDIEHPFSSWPGVFKTYTPDDAAQDPSWHEAVVGVYTNDERAWLNHVRGVNFAKHRNTRVIRWPVKADLKLGDHKLEGANGLPRHILQDIFTAEPQLNEYFIEYAPTVITHNVNVERRIANGSDSRFHSIVFASEGADDSAHYTTQTEYEDLAKNARPGAVITLSKPPVGLRVSVPGAQVGKNHPRDEHENPIITLTRRRQQRNNEISLQTRETFAVMHAHKMSFAPLKAHITECFDVDMMFASTVYKLQGKTLSKLVMSVAGQQAATYEKILTLFTRTRSPDDARILESREEGEIDKLLKTMTVTRNTRAFLKAYDAEGKFQKDKCAAMLESRCSPGRTGKRNEGRTLHPKPAKKAKKHDTRDTALPDNTLAEPPAPRREAKKRRASQTTKPPVALRVPTQPRARKRARGAEPSTAAREIPWEEPLHSSRPENFPKMMIRPLEGWELGDLDEWNLGELGFSSQRNPWLGTATIDNYAYVLMKQTAGSPFCTSGGTTEGPLILPAGLAFSLETKFNPGGSTSRLPLDDVPGIGLPCLDACQISLKDYPTILMPSNVDGNHWILLMAQPRANPPTVCCMDSRQTSESQTTHGDLMARMGLWVDSKTLDSTEDPRQWQYVNIETPKQITTFQCGVFTLLFCKLICSKAPFAFDESSLNWTRARIAMEISSNIDPEEMVPFTRQRCPRKVFFGEKPTQLV